MIALLYLLAAAGFLLSRVDYRTSQAQRASVEAFYRADGALQEFLGTARGYPERPRTYRFAGGEATLSPELLLSLPGGDRIYRLRSRATLVPPEGGVARRAVGVSLLAVGPPSFPATLTYFNTLQSAGGSGTVSGLDGAPAPGCLPDSAAGILLSGAGEPGDGLVVSGSPPIRRLSGTDEVASLLGIRWESLRSTEEASADAVVPPGAWPDFGSVDPGEWPVVYLTEPGRLDARHAGRGVLVALSDLELEESFRWEGVVLVGGRLWIAGPVRIEGAAVAGLDILLGREVPSSRLEGSGIDLRFHSCHVDASMAALGLPPVAFPGSWFEEMEALF